MLRHFGHFFHNSIKSRICNCIHQPAFSEIMTEMTLLFSAI